mmetsp:Transcript_1124/g.1992  ORF Transcript_1124/g.1992 Transcript_1124/m.1992 type:complete len:294 (-) Transcript_1124:324-1205(-)
MVRVVTVLYVRFRVQIHTPLGAKFCQVFVARRVPSVSQERVCLHRQLGGVAVGPPIHMVVLPGDEPLVPRDASRDRQPHRVDIGVCGPHGIGPHFAVVDELLGTIRGDRGRMIEVACDLTVGLGVHMHRTGLMPRVSRHLAVIRLCVRDARLRVLLARDEAAVGVRQLGDGHRLHGRQGVVPEAADHLRHQAVVHLARHRAVDERLALPEVRVREARSALLAGMHLCIKKIPALRTGVHTAFQRRGVAPSTKEIGAIAGSQGRLGKPTADNVVPHSRYVARISWHGAPRHQKV